MYEVLERISKTVSKSPHKVAITDGTETLTYKQFDARASELARKLLGLCPSGEGFIGYYGPPGAPFLVVFLACLKSGLTFLPVNRKFPPISAIKILQTAGTQVWVSDALDPKDDPDVKVVGLWELEDEGETFLKLGVSGDVLAGASTTSGTSGLPKLVGHSRSNLQQFLKNHVVSLGLKPGAVFGHAGTLWFSAILGALAYEGKVACIDPSVTSVPDLFRWLKTEKVSHWSTYPALFRLLTNMPDTLANLKRVALCGEPILQSDFRIFEALCEPGADLIVAYAQQEYYWATSFEVSYGTECLLDTLPAGKPFPENTLSILDPNGELTAPGEIGEIAHRSHLVSHGYIGNPEKTAEVFKSLGNGIRQFLTGDLGFFDREDNLHYVGRKDDQQKIRGFNVLPSDLERELAPHPDIQEVAVVIDRCGRGLPRLICFYKGDISAKDILAWLKPRIPAFMIPQFFIPVQEFPRTGTGKLQRNKLKLPSNITGTNPVVAQGHNEEKLWGLWAEILGHESFGVTDNFFDIGGDSLRAVELLLLVSRHFPRTLTIDTFVLAGATIRDMAMQVLQDSQQKNLKVLRPGNGSSNLIVAHVFDGGVSDFLDFARVMPSSIGVLGVTADYSARDRNFPVQQKAREAVSHIKDQNGVLVGYSFGGLLAFEMASQIGDQRPLILIDPHTPFRHPRIRSLLRRVNETIVPARFVSLDKTAPCDFRYKPEPLKTKGALLIFCDTTNTKHERIWRDLLDGPVQVLRISGKHKNVLRGANTIEVAQIVQTWLADNPQQDKGNI